MRCETLLPAVRSQIPPMHCSASHVLVRGICVHRASHASGYFSNGRHTESLPLQAAQRGMGGEEPIPLSVCRRTVYDRGRTATGGLGPSRTRQRLVSSPLCRCTAVTAATGISPVSPACRGGEHSVAPDITVRGACPRAEYRPGAQSSIC